MMQLLIGMLLGAMVSTPTGRSIGNQIGDAALNRAMELVHTCDTVIDAGVEIGPCNRRMEEILRAAEKENKRKRKIEA